VPECPLCAVILTPLFQNSVGYHMSVTRLPSKKDVMEEVNQECRLCPEAVRRTVTTMLDMSLLRSPTFLLLAVSGFITMMGFYVPFMYMTGERRIRGSNKTVVGPPFTEHVSTNIFYSIRVFSHVIHRAFHAQRG